MADAVHRRLADRATTRSSAGGSSRAASCRAAQWQKVALARAFMREEADILVLDEPTAAMDAEAEATIFEHFRDADARARSRS